MEKMNELNEEKLAQITGGDEGFIRFTPAPDSDSQGVIYYDPSKVVDNVLKCGKCGYVLNQGGGPACLTAYCPACGAPLF